MIEVQMVEKLGLFPWSDESLIEQQNDVFVNGNKDLLEHMKVIVAGLGFLQVVLYKQPHETSEEVTALRLGVRLLNSGSAAFKLARAGFCHPALTMVRDLMEVEFLIDLFSQDRALLTKWLSLSAKERERQFSPVTVRVVLDERDGWTEKKREKAYKLLCAYAAHVTPEGFVVISPNDLTIIGPHPSPRAVKVVIEELIKVLPSACGHFGALINPEVPKIVTAHSNFLRVLGEWLPKYVSSSNSETTQSGPLGRVSA
jgi:hypothetical protein